MLGGAERARDLLARLGFTFIFVVMTALIAEPYLESLTWALVLAILFIRPHRWFESHLGPNSAAGMSVAAVALICIAGLALAQGQLEKKKVVIGFDHRFVMIGERINPTGRKLLAEEIDAVIVQAHHLQVPPPEFLELVRDRVDVFDEKRRARDGRNPE